MQKTFIDVHCISFLGAMKIKFYWKDISTIVILEKKKKKKKRKKKKKKKKFQIVCHMIGLYHYWDLLGRGMGVGLCKKCKGLPDPSAQFCLIMVWPYHVTPLFQASFSQIFHFCHSFFIKILLSIGSHLLDVVCGDIYWELWGRISPSCL